MENWARGAIAPESHPAPFEVEVWATESLFVQVTVVPTATSTASGLNALFPSVDAPLGILTGVPEPAMTGAGVGVGAVVESLLPQAVASNASADTRTTRDDNMKTSK